MLHATAKINFYDKKNVKFEYTISKPIIKS